MGYAFGGSPSYDTRHRVVASDGWPLALYEYRPRAPGHGVPVLLVHGTNARYRIFDPGERQGLAPYLARAGFHVFALDMRGRGLSLPRRTGPRLRRLVGGWTLDDMMRRDLPAAFAFIVAHTGAPVLDYVGHSLGGMLAIELLARTHDARVRRVVALASGDAQALLVAGPRRPGSPPRVNVGLLLAPFALTTPYAPLEWGGKLAALGLSLVPARVLTRLPIERRTLQRFLWHGTSGISARKFRSFGAFHRRAQRPARYVFAHPALYVAGAGDRTMPPERVRAAAARASHDEVRVEVVGRSSGASFDYGHNDLLLAPGAERDVFGIIASFLAGDADHATVTR